MDIKEILLNGGCVTFSYKEKKKEWVGSAKIFSLSGGFGLKPKIIVEVPTLEIKGRAEFVPEDIDKAVELFERLVFCKKNLCYKKHKAMVNLYRKGLDLELDLDEDFKLMEKERLSLIKKLCPAV